jgi:hypothetical protein
MTGTICLPTNHLIIIFCVFIGFSAWYIHYDKKKHLDDPNYKYSDHILKSLIKNINQIKEENETQKINKQQNVENMEEKMSDFMEKRLFLNQRDVEVVYNDLIAPERRLPEHSYPTIYVKRGLNIPSRGYPDNYQMLGVLLRNNTESAYSLFGRQTYPGSNQWEYYCIGDGSDIKIPLKVRGDREMDDGQTITVPGTDPTKGDFKVKLYKYDVPRYNPYVF